MPPQASLKTKGSTRAPASARSAYIAAWLPDVLWVVLCPVLAFFTMKLLWSFSGLSDLTIYAILFAFVVTGHHLPGWFRAFGEPAVYKRYRARLWTSVVAVPALVILPTIWGLGAAALTVAASFDLWHVAMQQHGFGRIYAAKAGDTGPGSAKFDLLCVLTWYATVVVWSDSWMHGIARTLRKTGIGLFSLLQPSGWRAIQWSFLLASVALAATYVVRAVRLRRLGVRTPIKHVLHAAAFGVLILSYQDPSWYRAQSVQNLFHAIQYFFMVWIYGHLSLRRKAEQPRPFYRMLFQHRRGILLFAAGIGLYGLAAFGLSSSGYRLNGVDAQRQAQIIGSIGLASLLLHFYVDSFIWKVRSREVRSALGISERSASATGVATTPTTTSGAPTPLRESWTRGVAHAVGYFGVPIGLILIVHARAASPAPQLEIAALAHEAALFPRSAVARGVYGQALCAAGQFGPCRREALAAFTLAPSVEGPAAMLAELDRRSGDHASEIEHLEAAVRASPKDPILHYALGNAFAFTKNLSGAEDEYETVIRLLPKFAGAQENLGVLYKWRGQLDLALPHFRRAYALDPDLAEAACNLAGALATQGQKDEALAVLGDYRARHPRDTLSASLESAIRKDAGQ